MTEHQDHLAVSLQGLDIPIAPDPGFANRLESRLLAGANEPRRLTPMPDRQPAHPTSIRSKKRLFDFAAVAVLVLATIGGLAIGARQDSAKPTPFIYAPLSPSDGDLPVMVGGTAAHDNQFANAGPIADEYELAWRPDESNGLSYPALSYGSTLYTLSFPTEAGQETNLAASDITSGDLLWRVSVTRVIGFAVSASGIITAVIPETISARPASARSSPFQVVLLDPATGLPKWRSEQIYGGWDGSESGNVLIKGETVVFTDAAGTVVALDLATGHEQWRYTYDRVLGAGVEPGVCFGIGTSAETCIDRFLYAPMLAMHEATIYVADRVTGTVTALSTDQGVERWTVHFHDRFGERPELLSLMATEIGVVVQMQDALAKSDRELSYMGLWDVTNGAERWRNDLPTGPGLASDGASLFITRHVEGESCCPIASLSLDDGSVEWELANGMTWIVGYLPESQTLVVGSLQSQRVTIGINVETQEQSWEYRHFENECQLQLPIPESGYLICSSPDAGLSILKPREPLSDATPAP